MAEPYFAPCAAGVKNEQIEASTVHMTSPTTGWASADCTLAAGTENSRCQWPLISQVGIVRTTDGGRDWVDVSPPSITSRTWPHAEFFLDATHAWVAEVSYGTTSCVDQLTTYSTTDGGRSWNAGGTITLNTGPTDAVFNIATPTGNWLDFISPLVGWLLVPWWPTPAADSGNPTQQAALYSTTDGGTTWTFLVRNPGQSAMLHARGCAAGTYGTIDMTWASSTDGWLVTDCPATTIIHSADAGRHWAVEPLPSCVCGVFYLQFVDAQHGFLTGDVMLTTSDGGATWQKRSLPHGDEVTVFVDPLHGHALVLEQQVTTYDVRLFNTADGGATWLPGGVLPIPIVPWVDASGTSRASAPGLYMQLASDKTGYVAALPSHHDPTATTEVNLVLVATADGGATWKTVFTQYSTAACDTYGAPPVAPVPVLIAAGGEGWAAGGLRTVDGGATWNDVSPPAMREHIKTALYPPGYTDFYLDPDHAWQAANYSSPSACQDHVITFATANGGQSWTASAPIPIPTVTGHRYAGMELSFSSALTGSLLLEYGNNSIHGFAPSLDMLVLFSTADGGSHWNHVADVSLPSIAAAQCYAGTGQIQFGSATFGWLPVYCGGTNRLLATTDGGVTWNALKSPFPIGSARLFDTTHGVGVIDYGDHVGVATTSDGGMTWRNAAALPTTGCKQFVTCNGDNPTLYFGSSTDFWDFVAALPLKSASGPTVQTGNLFHSGDGGATWHLVQANVRFGTTNGSPLDILSFVMAADGHGLMAADDGSSDGSGFVLFGSSDGGHTWTQLGAQVQRQS